jgi:ribose transport system substrate-binding protein
MGQCHPAVEGLVETLGGKGNSVIVTGGPGVSVDILRTEAAKVVFARDPEINIVAEALGMWGDAVARTALTRI